MKNLGDDLLRGVKSIADYLGPLFSQRSVYHMVESNSLPIFRLPNNTTIYARKSDLDRHFSAERPVPSEPKREIKRHRIFVCSDEKQLERADFNHATLIIAGGKVVKNALGQLPTEGSVFAMELD